MSDTDSTVIHTVPNAPKYFGGAWDMAYLMSVAKDNAKLLQDIGLGSGGRNVEVDWGEGYLGTSGGSDVYFAHPIDVGTDRTTYTFATHFVDVVLCANGKIKHPPRNQPYMVNLRVWINCPSGNRDKGAVYILDPHQVVFCTSTTCIQRTPYAGANGAMDTAESSTSTTKGKLSSVTPRAAWLVLDRQSRGISEEESEKHKGPAVLGLTHDRNMRNMLALVEFMANFPLILANWGAKKRQETPSSKDETVIHDNYGHPIVLKKDQPTLFQLMGAPQAAIIGSYATSKLDRLKAAEAYCGSLLGHWQLAYDWLTAAVLARFDEQTVLKRRASEEADRRETPHDDESRAAANALANKDNSDDVPMLVDPPAHVCSDDRTASDQETLLPHRNAAAGGSSESRGDSESATSSGCCVM